MAAARRRWPTCCARLPPEASVANPLDLLADAREDRFGLPRCRLTHAADAYDMVLMIHVVPFMVDAAPVIGRLADSQAARALPVMHSMMGTMPGKADWFATMEGAGVPMFNDVEAMAEAAGLVARYPATAEILPVATLCPPRFSTTASGDKPGKARFSSIYRHLQHCCIFATFRWT